jgi:predicted DNA-binding protein (MmcQ/YjbR family)
LWPDRYPTYCVFRHRQNRKWFALVGAVKGTTLGLSDDELVDIINPKFDTGMALEFASNADGIYPAYHMNKKNWITIALDDTLTDEAVMDFVNKSYVLTD